MPQRSTPYGPAPVRAQQPMRLQTRQRRGGVADTGGRPGRSRGTDGRPHQWRRGQSGQAASRSVSTNVTLGDPERNTSTAASASAVRTARARSSMAPLNRQVWLNRTIPRAAPSMSPGRSGYGQLLQRLGHPRVAHHRGLGDVGQHRTRLDRGQLVGIADQDQASVWSDRLQQSAPSGSARPSTSRRPPGRRAEVGCRHGGGTGYGCPGRQPRSRCTVDVVRALRAPASAAERRAPASRIAAPRRAAALPVGAANATRPRPPG